MKKEKLKILVGALCLMAIIACNNTAPNAVTEKPINEGLKHQLEMTPKTMEELRKIGVTDDKLLKVEFFFYTPKIEDASNLAEDLKRLNYDVEYRLGADTTTIEYVVTGLTTKLIMTDDAMIKWTKEMWEIGDKNHAEFDGWGTSPESEEFN